VLVLQRLPHALLSGVSKTGIADLLPGTPEGPAFLHAVLDARRAQLLLCELPAPRRCRWRRLSPQLLREAVVRAAARRIEILII
jgi:hypothetical protein